MMIHIYIHVWYYMSIRLLLRIIHRKSYKYTDKLQLLQDMDI